MSAESIAVYARVRGSSDEVVTSADKPGSIVVRNLEFSLDAAFDESISQQAVYDAAAHAQVERVLQGLHRRAQSAQALWLVVGLGGAQPMGRCTHWWTRVATRWARCQRSAGSSSGWWTLAR